MASRRKAGRLQNADGDITLFGCDMQNIKCKADYGDVELKSGTWRMGRSRWRMAMRKSKIRSFPETCRWKTPTAILNLNWVKRSGTAGNYGKDRFWGDRCTGYHGESDAERGRTSRAFSLCTGSASGQRITLMTKDGDISLEND